LSSSDITKIITVTISRQTTGVSRVGFGTLLFVSEIALAVFTERTKTYANLDAVSEDFESTTNVYKAASAYFSQALKPTSIIIGRKLPAAENGGTAQTFTAALNDIRDENDGFYAVAIDSRQIDEQEEVAVWVEARSRLFFYAKNDDVNKIIVIEDVGTYTAGNIDVDVVIDGAAVVPISEVYDSDKDTTLGNLAVSIAAVVGIDTCTYTPGTNTFLIESALSDIGVTFDLNAITGTMTIASTETSDAKSTGTLDIFSTLQGLSFNRSVGLYSGTADGSTDDQWAEIAWAGLMLPTDPGSATWKFKTLAGVTADTFTDTERANLQGKNANIYETVGGVSITQEGVVAVGEFIDIIRGVDWLEVRIQEDVYALFVNVPKVPYTDAGITSVESIVSARLTNAIGVGLLAEDPPPTTTVPRKADIDPADVVARTLNNVKFDATLAGAIHFVNVTGVVTV
jgi:hypothetical protein